MKPKVLVPVGYGLNCEAETVYTYELLGAEVDEIFVKDLCENPSLLEDYHIIDFMGGFSDGDHIAAGRVHANRLKYHLREALEKFIVEDEKLVIGVCNGFQALVNSGILPEFDNGTQKIGLIYNNSGKFEDRWVHLAVNEKSNCVWTKEIKELYLPVRHGEGKIRVKDKSVLNKLKKNNQIVLFYADPQTKKPTMEYPYNPNGSDEAIAAICDPTGRVLGKMPHREACWSPYNYPNWTRLKIEGKLPKEGEGLQISRNGIEYVKEHLI